MEMNQMQSEELAMNIKMIAFYVVNIDLEYLKLSAQKFAEQASFQDSASILNPRYNPDKNKALHASSRALNTLVTYIEQLKEIDKHKSAAREYDGQINEIDKIFF